MTNPPRAKPLLGTSSKNYVRSDTPTMQTKFIQPTESLPPEPTAAARVRQCADLCVALAWLLDAAALRAGMSASRFLLLEIRGPTAWYPHQKGRKRITPAKYREYRDVLCATDAERDALDQHWFAYRARHQQPGPPQPITSGANDPGSPADVSVTSRTLDIAIALAEESTTLRLSRPKPPASFPPSHLGHLPFRSAEPRQIINALVQLGIACNGQATDTVAFFVANQDNFQKVAADLTHFGPTAVDEVNLAQSVSCLLRFSMPSLQPEDRQFWGTFCEQLDHRLADEGEWLYRLRHQLPAYASASPAVWRMQHQRARHFLDALQARATRPIARPDQIDAFLGLGSCVLGAYSYLLRSQLVALTRDPEQLLRQVEDGERVIGDIRRLGDNDTTRRLLDTTATDSERVYTALSTVYRSMANLLLMSSWSAGWRERQLPLRHARKNIRIAHDLLLADRPPWLHGIANTFVSAAGVRFCERRLPAARLYLVTAAEAYRRTADWPRAAMCDDAAIKITTEPESVDWLQLIFVE